MTASLPESIQVLERGWLSSNSVLLFDGETATLVDSGYVTEADETVAMVNAALRGRTLTRLINTHSHSDHIGGNAAVQRAFGCRITVPETLAPIVARWDRTALLLDVAGQNAEPFSVDETIAPGDTFVAGGLCWEAIAAPGHDATALVFYNREHGVLLSGDALWADGFGILFGNVLGSHDALPDARNTLKRLQSLAVQWVIPGHGAPFQDFAGALDRAWGRLEAFAKEPERIARNALRACFAFYLLEHRRLTRDAIRSALATIPLFVQANDRFLHQSPEALTEWVAAALVAAGRARWEGETLVALIS
ncbi:MBL fold metallo-hydrolase [Hydrogenophilus thermoluteolus]|jgi:glyoxylase-like metal-dependent hydrolase (beta-lactamase superfamily II)|nr:MBL fold metallo-hydrolase [Hydrogenophilus thermoluteolus]MBW7657494.1 MBL fold metallo-hydrolase [Hydrogenophilus thermoluteolus]HCO77979.1 MBL fold metallo-hydrolase [Rhodocyclaceae bacterium]HNQ48542.1 MBL fold metallo-hydrolase [Hydrogenophilus thermoluteolus]HNU19987.1 MBL fold metallo-hydrolase [Hydrogenophilus thermoluteolus]